MGAVPVRQLSRPDGRMLTIRPGGPDDVDGLLDLYRGLDAEDRHRRFFTASMPPRRTVEIWSRVAERGGVLLVVEADDPPGRIVAEAGCDLLPNGDGEFAVTVARDWRGWLGPFLFSLLLEAAADLGMPNVEGDILLENSPMLAIARAHGFAVAERLDPSTTRVVLSTTGGTPTWPPSDDRGRVLVEAGAFGWRGERALRDAGYSVLVCPGPPVDHLAECPLLAGRPCPLVEGADAVVLALPVDREPGRSLLTAQRARTGAPPCIEATSCSSVADVVVQVTAVSPSRPPRTASGRRPS